jgi:hypothetical protein
VSKLNISKDLSLKFSKERLLKIFSFSNIKSEFLNPTLIPGLKEQKLRQDFLLNEYLSSCLFKIFTQISRIDLMFLFILKLFFTFDILVLSKSLIIRTTLILIGLFFFLLNYIKIVKISRLPLAKISSLKNQFKLYLKLPIEELSKQIKPLPRIFLDLSEKIEELPGLSNLQRQYFLFGLPSLPIWITKYLELFVVTDCFFHCFDIIFSHKIGTQSVDIVNYVITGIECLFIFIHIAWISKIQIERQVMGTSLLYFKNYQEIENAIGKRKEFFQSIYLKLNNRFKWLYRVLQLGKF